MKAKGKLSIKLIKTNRLDFFPDKLYFLEALKIILQEIKNSQVCFTGRNKKRYK